MISSRRVARLFPGARRFATGSVPSSDRLAVLCILDGWGYRETAKDNAVVLARTPNFDALYGHHSQRGQVAFLDACEREVGLPVGQIGNSEVGHMNIGAGRIVWQDLCTIDNAIADDNLKEQASLLSHIAKLKASGGSCHLLSLVSPGGVHAMQKHVAALANTVSAAGVPVIVHAFTDGRDVPPQDAKTTMPLFLASLNTQQQSGEGGAPITIGSVTGRYYAMDRDNRWERVGTAYDVIVSGKGVAPAVDTPGAAIAAAYASGVGDEFVLPTVVGDYGGMKDGDGLLMANFRADRAREILSAILDPDAPEELFNCEGSTGRGPQPKLADACGMVQYSDRHAEYMSAIFPPKDIPKPLGEVVADAGLTQLRTAETEK
jgi:2,3-bisphosphoglycerate-independent phosphoglycerate mutase